MKRQTSYSDSFLLINSSGEGGQQQTLSRTPTFILLGSAGEAPVVSPPLPQLRIPLLESEDRQVDPAITVWPQRITLFLFQGSLHVLCISAFETAFYFLYVNKAENDGILHTIDTYYNPLVTNCEKTWSNYTRYFVEGLFTLYGINETAIDSTGNAARAHRESHNQTLLIWSSIYSVICLAACLGLAGIVRWKRWPVAWGKLLLENLSFVVLLGLYEVFFFRTIIYNYGTLSTAELNQYLIDGLARCAALPSGQS